MKKLLAGIMAGVLVLSSATVAFADENAQDAAAEKASMQEALTAVKQRVTIPEELENFDYSHSTSINDDSFTFTWSNDRGDDYSYLTITIKDSIITNYNTYSRSDYEGDSNKLGKLTMPELCAAAQSELAALNPTLGDRIEINTAGVSAYLGNREVTFSINRVFKDIPVSNDRGYISIDKDSGDLISFRLNWHSNASFKSASKAIGNAAAQKAYASMVALKPVYRVEYDYDTDTYSTKIVYVQTEYGEINAFSGKKSNFQEDGYYDDKNADCEDDCATAEAADAGGVTFTQNELNELDKNAKLITKEKLAEMLKNNKYFNYSDKMQLENFYVYSEKVNGVKSYYIRANYSLSGYTEWFGDDDAVEDSTEAVETIEKYAYLNVTLNGETGAIVNYNYYDSDNRDASSLDESKAALLVKKIAAELAGDKFGEYKLSDSGVDSYQPYDDYTKTYGDTVYTGYYADYDRFVNGIEVENDSIRVRLNGDLSLNSYSIGYTENVEFISKNGMLTVDGALEKIWKQTELTLNYKVRTLDNITKSVLVYTAGANFECDAFTGELLNNYSYEEEKPEYSDLSGKLKNKVEMLRMYGFYFDDVNGKFMADRAITIDELDKLTNRSYLMATDADDAETEKAADKKATRAYVVALMVESEYGSSVADLKGIFKSPFSDVSEDSEYVGYVAIAVATGLIEKTEKFNPDAAMTRGELIEILYNYLSK